MGADVGRGVTVARERMMRFGVPAAIAGVLAGIYLFASPAAHRSTSTMPDRLADSTFWRLSTDMSERGGYFRSDNFVGNELALQSVIPGLRRHIDTGGVYLGVGPDQNFTYIIALKPRMAFIVDIRRQNAMELLMYKALLELSTDRADFLSRLFARPRPGGLDSATDVDVLLSAYDHGSGDTARFDVNLADILHQLRVTHGFTLSAEDSASIAFVYHAFYLGGPNLTYSFGQRGGRQGPFGFVPRAFGFGGRGGRPGMPTYSTMMTGDDGAGRQLGYLATELNFRTLQGYERRNAIVPIVGDFAGPKALHDVGALVAAHRATVDAFYTSNV